MTIECKKILIPTLHDMRDMDAYVEKIKKFCPDDVSVFCSCEKASASVNRNICLNHLEAGEVAIMMDDDMDGFYDGWINDLTSPMTDDSVVMVSARLMRTDGKTPGESCAQCHDMDTPEVEIKRHGDCVLPTAAIAFRYTGIRFDENFKGSGWEDNDFCLQYLEKDPCSKFILSNRTKLIHLNEMKNQKGKFWEHNIGYFRSKWSTGK